MPWNLHRVLWKVYIWTKVLLIRPVVYIPHNKIGLLNVNTVTCWRQPVHYFYSQNSNLVPGDNVLCATYLINQMSLWSIDKTSSYFQLYKYVPSLDNLRNFSCLCYISTSKVNNSKFQPRADLGVFLGYPSNQKGYKVLNYLTNRVLVSRDVTFLDFHFLFLFISTNFKS